MFVSIAIFLFLQIAVTSLGDEQGNAHFIVYGCFKLMRMCFYVSIMYVFHRNKDMDGWTNEWMDGYYFSLY